MVTSIEGQVAELQAGEGVGTQHNMSSLPLPQLQPQPQHGNQSLFSRSCQWPHAQSLRCSQSSTLQRIAASRTLATSPISSPPSVLQSTARGLHQPQTVMLTLPKLPTSRTPRTHAAPLSRNAPLRQ